MDPICRHRGTARARARRNLFPAGEKENVKCSRATTGRSGVTGRRRGEPRTLFFLHWREGRTVRDVRPFSPLHFRPHPSPLAV